MSLRIAGVVRLAIISLIVSVPAASAQSIYFEEFLTKRFANPTATTAWAVDKLCSVSSDIISQRVFENYGAMFVAADPVLLPGKCVHDGESEVLDFQKGLKTTVLDIGGVQIELQISAAESLKKASDEAILNGLQISPLDGSIAGRRSYGQTLMLWNSRYVPALEYWTKNGKLTPTERAEIDRLDLREKIRKVIQLEERGIYFSTNKRRSILTSVAPPGTSQHLALIAFDVVEYWNPTVRAVLNKHGWYQTIVDDAPHFTYLGVAETELPARGLKAVSKGGFQYWVPNMSPRPAVAQSAP